VKLFLDSSKVDEAKRWMPVIDGATTNPTILKKDGSDIYEFCKMMDPKPVSVEACGDFITEARQYAKDIPNAIIKIPLLKPYGGDNLQIIKELAEEHISINCTALFNLSQVILAAKAGARYCSLFIGRIDDEGVDYKLAIEDCVRVIDLMYRTNTTSELIVGSVRSVGQFLDAVRAGSHIVTVPPSVLEKLVEHKFSRATVQMFEEDSQSLKQVVGSA